MANSHQPHRNTNASDATGCDQSMTTGLFATGLAVLPVTVFAQPGAAVGTDAKWFSAIQLVVNGTRDNQNRRCRFAHSTAPLTRATSSTFFFAYRVSELPNCVHRAMLPTPAFRLQAGHGRRSR